MIFISEKYPFLAFLATCALSSISEEINIYWFRSWTCEECKGAIWLLTGAMTYHSYVTPVVTYLQGEAFCKDGNDHGEMCEQDVAKVLPIAWEILAIAFADHQDTQLCRDAAGVC